MAFGFSGGSAENIRPRPPLREDFAIIREEPNLRVAFEDNPEEEYEVERVDADGSATVVGSSSSPDILVPSQAQEHRVVAKNSELGIQGTPSVPKKELKPDHRWQMPLPRNLLSDPESFDPNTTVWEENGDINYVGTTNNVGPNGETAHEIKANTNNVSLLNDSDKYTLNTKGVTAFYVRAKTGTHELNISIRLRDYSYTTVANATIGTEWEWISGTFDNGIRQILLASVNPGSFYVLRAGLNRGSSLEYSTRSEVPQEIPDVVQGADLSNGSTSGPDTNDLDFGVDSQGVLYAVSDGSDETSTVTDHEGTWVFRFYYTGSFWLSNIGDSRLGANASDEVILDLLPGSPDNITVGPISQDSWHTAYITLKDGEAPVLNVNGQKAVGNGLYDLASANAASPINAGEGNRFSHLEQHPVLTEAEAEAVRQRLAQNPADPVPPTEAWDFTAETNPHNLDPNSSNFDPETSLWGVNSNVSVTTDVDGDADKIEDPDSNAQGYLEQSGVITAVPTKVASWVIKVKKDSDTSRFPEFLFREKTSTISEIRVRINTKSGGFNVEFISDNAFTPKIIDKGEYWLLSMRLTTQSDHNGFLRRIFPARDTAIDGSGDLSATGSITVKESQVVVGDDVVPPYAPTNGSIAFPQTVPALRQSANDLTLGSSSGADTNDGSWIAPIGMAEDGDDQLRAPTKRPTVTWIERVKYTATRAFGRSANGWKVTTSDLVVEDTNGNTASAAHGKTINDGVYHTLAVTIGEVAGVAEVYIDGVTTPDATVDLSTVGTLKSSDVELLAEGGTIKQPAYYTRALSGEEIAYLHERLVDNPQSAHPEYTNP